MIDTACEVAAAALIYGFAVGGALAACGLGFVLVMAFGVWVLDHFPG